MSHPVGGKSKPLLTLASLDSFFLHWSTYARSINLNELDILQFRASLFLKFGDLTKCYNNNSDKKAINDFLEKNDKIIIVPSDKTKHLTIMYFEDYKNKISLTFSDTEKFEPLSEDPMKDNKIVIKFRKQLQNIKPFLNKKTFKSILPIEAIKRGYGLLKKHRNDKIRPIVSSINSLTQGCENFLYKILSPLEDKCKFLIKSTKNFKEIFLQKSPKFDKNKHTIVSWDANQLYTNINTKMVIEYILDLIYENPSNFFNEGCNIVDGQEIDIQIPPRRIFQNFLYDVLLNFNVFSTVSGIYKQLDGLGMGSRLSSIISNLYVSLMENEIIQNYIDNEKIILYVRFADDILVILDQNIESEMFTSINSWDPQFLKCKTENMSENSLPFLDTQIIIKNDLELCKYRKPMASDCVLNYYAITAKKYKISTLKGEIYRCRHTTSNDKNCDEALVNLKKVFIKNQYPSKLIDQTIAQIRENNFEPKKQK